jgi:hypothetical protein
LALGREIERAEAWGDKLAAAITERWRCLIQWARGCRRVAAVALRLGLEDETFLVVARWCEQYAWQGMDYEKAGRWARIGRLAETAEDPHVRPLFEERVFRRDMRRAARIVDRLETILTNNADGGQDRGRRCRLQLVGGRVLLDGNEVPLGLTAERRADALCYLGHLIRAGDWISGSEVDAAETKRGGESLAGTRWDRLRDVLPEDIQDLIETNRKKGTRLRPEAWRR